MKRILTKFFTGLSIFALLFLSLAYFVPEKVSAVLNIPPSQVTLTSPMDNAYSNDDPVNLDWEPTSDDDGGPSPLTYELEYNLQYGPVTQINIGAGTDYDLTGKPSGIYEWRARAYDGLDYGPFSERWTLTLDYIDPVADPGVYLSQPEDRDLTFDAGGSTDVPSGIATYEWDLNNNGIYEISGPIYLLKGGFKNPGNYTVNLKVTDNAGNSSIASTIINVYDVKPTAPLLAALRDGKRVKLSWTKSKGADRYVVIRYNRGIFKRVGEFHTGIQNMTDLTAESGETYVYQVLAKDNEGNSIGSNGVIVQIPFDTIPRAAKYVSGEVSAAAQTAGEKIEGITDEFEEETDDQIGDEIGDEEDEGDIKGEDTDDEDALGLESTNWPLVVAVVIAALIVIGGALYWWYSREEDEI